MTFVPDLQATPANPVNRATMAVPDNRVQWATVASVIQVLGGRVARQDLAEDPEAPASLVSMETWE